MILNSIRSINNKFKNEYGQLIIAYDSKNSWRKGIFPYYKAHRKRAQEKSPIDWIKLFEYFNRIKPELKEVLPYKVIEVERCEADDIIGTLTRFFSTDDSVMIVSGDKDFIQLHSEKVKQYDPVQKKMVSSNKSPEDFLFEHILRGDVGDGIPNVLSDDDTFVNSSKRQKPLTQKKIDMFMNSFEDVDAQINKNVERNEKLIDLGHTPEELTIAIMDDYVNQHRQDRAKLFKYLLEKKCNYLVGQISDF